uniref:Uncharacterized protein n=1 Tax=Human herpesvirus 1 TaxID=10298 RepID=A0A2Z4H416_HHV1|nr:hypothetical protein [Human alphaherpesvirus 1]
MRASTRRSASSSHCSGLTRRRKSGVVRWWS